MSLKLNTQTQPVKTPVVAPAAVATRGQATTAAASTEAAAPKTWVGNPSTAASGPAGQASLTRLNQLNSALQSVQTTGKLGTAVANVMTGGAYGSAAKKRDELISNVNALAERLIAKDGGKLSNKSANLLDQAIDMARESIEMLGDIRSGVVNTTANVATAAVLTVAAVPSGGASIAALATIGAGAKAGSKVAMEGTGYTHAQAAEDIATGAAEGAVAGVLNKAGKAAQNKLAANATAKAAANQSQSARSVINKLNLEFAPDIGNQDPAVLKPLLQRFDALKAAGHVFTKAEERLAAEISRYVSTAKGPSAMPTGLAGL